MMDLTHTYVFLGRQSTEDATLEILKNGSITTDSVIDNIYTKFFYDRMQRNMRISRRG